MSSFSTIFLNISLGRDLSYHFIPDLLQCLLEQQNSLLGILSCLQLTEFYVSFVHFPVDHFTNQSCLFILDLSDTFADYGVHLSAEHRKFIFKTYIGIKIVKAQIV